jgi:hypothetical protein
MSRTLPITFGLETRSPVPVVSGDLAHLRRRYWLLLGESTPAHRDALARQGEQLAHGYFGLRLLHGRLRAVPMSDRAAPLSERDAGYRVDVAAYRLPVEQSLRIFGSRPPTLRRVDASTLARLAQASARPPGTAGGPDLRSLIALLERLPDLPCFVVPAVESADVAALLYLTAFPEADTRATALPQRR